MSFFAIAEMRLVGAIWGDLVQPFPGFVHFEDSVADRANLPMRFELSGNDRKLLRLPPIVAIEKCNNLAFAFRNSCVECRRLATI